MRANRLSINHYDHAVTSYIEDTPHEDNPITNPQLTEKFFIRSKYIFHLDSTDTKFDTSTDTILPAN